MKNTDISKSNSLSNKMKINPHMISTLMLNWVHREIDGEDVVAIDHNGSQKWVAELGR
jgi:hypothetical protein